MRLFLALALCLSMLPLALPQDAEAGLFKRRRSTTTGTVHIRNINHSWGFPGEVSYRARVIRLNAKPFRHSRNYLRLRPGTYTFEISWTNYQIPEHGGGKSSAWRFKRRGITTLVLTVEAGKAYEMTWPAWDRLGGPTGFKHKTRF